MTDYFTIRKLVVTEDQLQSVNVSNLSDLAREILASSDIPAVAAMADEDAQRANEAARALARDYFGVLPAGETSPP